MQMAPIQVNFAFLTSPLPNFHRTETTTAFLWILSAAMTAESISLFTIRTVPHIVSNRFQTLSVAHNYTSEVVKEPTYREAGLRKYTCSVCGDSYDEEIPALTPITGDVNPDGKVSVDDATCV